MDMVAVNLDRDLETSMSDDQGQDKIRAFSRINKLIWQDPVGYAP